LFFLLSGFFLAALLGAVERSRKLLGIAGACLVVLVCIIVFVKPVQLPSLSQLVHRTTTTTSPTTKPDDVSTSTTSSPATSANATLAPSTSTTALPGP
jgi:hypothetical protein